MKKRKILVTTGSRAEYGIIKPLLEKIIENKTMELILVVTGSHLSKEYGNSIKQIKNDGFKITELIKINHKKDDSFSTTIAIGKSIIQFAKCFKRIKPDLNIIIGDRYEMLASAIAAYHQNIPNVHIHGGDTSGGLDEYTRHAITKMSNIHFSATEKSKERIIKMGENSKFVFCVGSLTIDDVLRKKNSSFEDLKSKYGVSGNEVILLFHPDTTESEHSKIQINIILRSLIKAKCNIFAIGPNVDTGNKVIALTIKKFQKNYDKLKFFKTIPREDFLGLLNNCRLLIGNSSSGMIEASVFRIPVLNIGNRQNGREGGKNVTNVSFSEKEIFVKIKKLMNLNKSDLEINFIFGKGKSAEKIVGILEKICLGKDLIKKQITYD